MPRTDSDCEARCKGIKIIKLVVYPNTLSSGYSLYFLMAANL
jgi:hypothetical protein